jgi:hypothetical protein
MRSLRCARAPGRTPAPATVGRCAGALGIVVGLVVGLGGAALPVDDPTPAPVRAPEGTPGAFQGGRDVYAWPFSWDSIWNLPLAATAAYRPFDTRAQALELDTNNISVDPAAPVRQLRAEDEEVPVHVDPALSADGGWNNCSALLMDTADRRTVIQGQPMELEPGGDPSWEYGWPPMSLTDRGPAGCHGGSGLSGIGGAIRIGELPGDAPIRHALKIGLNCTESCSSSGGGFRWPATKADSGYEDKYGGTDPDVKMGSLLAVAPDADLSWITQPDVRKVAEAMRDYGAYVVDETANDKNFLVVQTGAEDEIPNIDSGEMRRLFRQLNVVTNSTELTPGGGLIGVPRRTSCAPPFLDGSGGAPLTCSPLAQLVPVS